MAKAASSTGLATWQFKTENETSQMAMISITLEVQISTESPRGVSTFYPALAIAGRSDMSLNDYGVISCLKYLDTN